MHVWIQIPRLNKPPGNFGEVDVTGWYAFRQLNGFVIRNVFTSTPVVVEYELPDYAATLDDVLHSLSEWGAMHKETIRKSLRKKKAPVA